MLNDEICKLRDKLNKSIEENASYDEIYKISVELDELIVRFYRMKTDKIGNCNIFRDNTINKKEKNVKNACNFIKK